MTFGTRRAGALALLLAAIGGTAQAQQVTGAAPDTTGQATVAPGAHRGAFELYGGLGNQSPQLGILGEAPGMSFGIVALRRTAALGAPPAPGQLPRWEWTVDLVPLARTSPPLVSLRGTGRPCPTARLCVEPPDPRPSGVHFPSGSAYGVGITPVGVTRRFRRGSMASPFVGVNGGALYFDRHAPTTKSSRFNFTASAELGLRIGEVDEPGLTIAYRFHHISNAGTAGENPGLASHLITLGVHRPRRAGNRRG